MTPPSETFIARFAARRALTATVHELTFEREDAEPLGFLPGQWLKLERDGRYGYFSIATAPGAPRFSLAVGHPGPWPTPLFEGLSPGELVRMHGPQGGLVRAATDATPSLFVGHGTGITPLRSMILAAHSLGDPPPMGLLYGARTEADALYRDEFDALVARGALSFDLVLSQPDGAWPGATGRVQSHLARAWSALRDRAGGVSPSVFVCGAREMVAAVRGLADGLPLSPEQVHFER